MASIQSESGVRSWLWRFCTVPLHLHFGPMMGPDVFVSFRGANGPPMASLPVIFGLWLEATQRAMLAV